MAQVDFYLLPAPGDEARLGFACRLAQKAYGLDHTVHLCAASGAEVATLDTLLWTFLDASFVPHEPWNGGQREAAVTLATTDAGIPADTAVVINLAGAPVTAGDWRIAEVIGADEAGRAAGRARYATYRDSGHTMNTHRL